MRRVCYISGARADFGLMRSTLQRLRDTPGLVLSVLATGMHLSRDYGHTVDEIAAAGLTVTTRISVPLEPATGATMARNIGTMLGGFVDAFETERPDVVLLLGDRGEMLAGALAAIHLNIPVAHIHGGERSGTVDEPVRHAVSKLAHLHFTATAGARARLIRMGEAPGRIHVTGAPGLDGLDEGPRPPRTELMRSHGLDPTRPLALLVYHPVLQEADRGAASTEVLLSQLQAHGCQVLALTPNSDAGGEAIRAILKAADGSPGLSLRAHLPRPEFLGAMAAADIIVGNSSAGIIEAASFGAPVLNVGSRQAGRERNANVTDVACTRAEVRRGIQRLLAHGRYEQANIYGDGHAGERITSLLAQTPLDVALLMKINRY